jgi:predicted nucleic acid-binding protein
LGHFVIDGSVTVAWCIPEERTSRTQALLDKVIEAGAVVPFHWWIEVGNALLVATRRARISVAQRQTALTQLDALQLMTDPETLDRLWTATLDLADRFRLTLYDATSNSRFGAVCRWRRSIAIWRRRVRRSD